MRKLYLARTMNRRSFLYRSAVSSMGLGLAATAAEPETGGQIRPDSGAVFEWRNKQGDMAYRKLGRTGLMISEVICGGDPIALDNYGHIELAIDMGLNYLDMAPMYRRGETEQAFGKLIARPSLRDRVLLTTKVSPYTSARDRMYQDVFDGLPSEKQTAIMKRAAQLRRERFVDKPGYFLEYFSGQGNGIDGAFRSNAMTRDYGHLVEGSRPFRKVIMDSVEGSLKRVGTDHFDILMCPHGACSKEELESPEIHQTFLELKQQGKVRFLGVTSHNNPAGVLRAASRLGYYDVAMIAYNVINGGYVEEAIREAAASGMGVIAMKSANPVARRHRKGLEPIPDWRIQKLQRIVPGDYTVPQKAYIWSLQNPSISAVISDLWNENYVTENLFAAGKRVDLRLA
ncbi:MAG: aldo/keto reductase [Planctomycetes bacterium]|nr:aldo/keto reductase [Planctomycetota bacterium]